MAAAEGSNVATTAADSFHDVGYHVQDGFLTENEATSLARMLVNADGLRHVYTPEHLRTVDAGAGDNDHYSLDRFELDALSSRFFDEYSRTFEEYVSHLGRYAGHSPYARSAYYCKVFRAPTPGQGWHYDTNCYSAILYLNTVTDEGGTELVARNGETVVVDAVAGRLLLLDGRRCWHRAQPLENSVKCTVLLNYYDAGHRPRDPRTDPLIFGD